jgi:hypothetical protein
MHIMCPLLGSASSLAPWTIEPRSGIDSCPTTVEQEILQIRNNISSILAGFMTAPQCGVGLWYQVAYLNMNSDSTQECPSNWNQTYTPVRACGRPTSTDPGVRCLGEYFSTRGVQYYGKVCGRVIGYQEGSADTFVRIQNQQPTIDEAYVDGVSVTHGMPRTHIWTFAAGASEGTVANFTTNCPCTNTWAAVNAAPAPSFVGDNYFCESGNSGGGSPGEIVYADDPLWDGKQCEGECCSDGKSPPWFSVALPNPTSDDIEVRICGDEDTDNEDTLIQLLEIFIQ